MSDLDTAIRVEGLGKRYKLGLVHHDRVADAVAAGMRWLGRGVGRLIGREVQATPSEVAASMPEAEQSFNGDYLWALRDVSLEVKRGEVLGIIGRNGAGKSTLLKILSRITEPTEGQAWIQGRVASLLEVGTGFHPELTGRENIFLNGAILGMSKAEIRAALHEIIDFAGIGRFIDTPVKRYSSGMYVRLAFAVAAHLNPEIMLVDEVLAVGDIGFQRKCLGKMDEVSKSGRTILFVSHRMEAILNLCSRACLVRDGRIAMTGDPEEVVEHYVMESMALSKSPLASRTDRSGSGVLVFQEVVFRDEQGKETPFVTCGKDCEIVLRYRCAHAEAVRDVFVGIMVTGPHGNVLLTCGNRESGFDLEDVREEGAIVCKIDKLPLSPGTYGLVLHGEANGGVADLVREAAFMEVAPGDFYGTGKLLPDSFKCALASQSWRAE